MWRSLKRKLRLYAVLVINERYLDSPETSLFCRVLSFYEVVKTEKVGLSPFNIMGQLELYA
jgi:hypothetical protein